jgi:two-component system CheB/CheR fusion protein
MEAGRDLPVPVTRPSSGLSVLIVEDQSDIAESEAMLLRLDGHMVQVARDGRTALGKVREWQPDVVLLDIGLPAMDGYRVAREIGAMNLWKRPVLIAVSGYAMGEDRQKSREAGIELHLAKPVPPDLLLRILRKVRAMLPP